ncbi:MAG: beta-CASP ribonuclease aCPSF1 [Nanoarchaeota archaeon]|nr:beta-CASP ribonuclease aCPSF1 [Nanoarchaeota archaeon]MBU1135555.1 beta-CASP ribonuclease aCPSF1 [Nanoarchaeota archaeon]MBU2520380.1 beta-CASP ribonuclease aCPSF1 [Nanoarchaeota archaeon]
MNILKELQERLPRDAMISEVKFEGSEIVIYTKNKQFFEDCERSVRGIVREIKKRVEIRPDISITMDQEKTVEEINKIVPKDAGLKEIYFEPELGKVIIEAQKPGLIIGKGGETYKKIRNTTYWLPKIERAPAINSDVVRAVRKLLHSEIPYRKKFLNKIGQKINEKIEDEKSANGKDNRWIRMSALGGFRQVGRSCILVQTQHSNILLDCGADPGSDDPPYLDAPEFDIEKLDAVVLSHAHIDHCAYVPYLYNQGYAGPLYCSAPTRDLMVLLCLDYIDVCQKNGKSTPYPKKAVEKAVTHSIALDCGEVSDIAPDTRLTLQGSGHLLGSSLIHLHIGNGLHNILYTGDLKFGPNRLFNPAYTDFQRVETLITESTYGGAGDRLPPRKEVEDKLINSIDETMKNGGKVLIPSFAVGRAQEVMAILGSTDFKYPVYMEGMVWDATAIHTAYPEYLSSYLQRDIFHKGNNPFMSEIFHRVESKERNAILESSKPYVVIATSGMLIGGPAIEYLKSFAPDEKNLLLFSGYQAEGTLGRRIQKGWREVPVAAERGRTKTLEIKMGVDTIHGLSGHSGRSQLMSYIGKLRDRPERVIVNHGDPKKCIEFARDVHKTFRCETLTPKNLEVVRLK